LIFVDYYTRGKDPYKVLEYWRIYSFIL